MDRSTRVGPVTNSLEANHCSVRSTDEFDMEIRLTECSNTENEHTEVLCCILCSEVIECFEMFAY